MNPFYWCLPPTYIFLNLSFISLIFILFYIRKEKCVCHKTDLWIYIYIYIYIYSVPHNSNLIIQGKNLS